MKERECEWGEGARESGDPKKCVQRATEDINNERYVRAEKKKGMGVAKQLKAQGFGYATRVAHLFVVFFFLFSFSFTFSTLAVTVATWQCVWLSSRA